MKNIELTDKEFNLFQKFIFKEIGISLENSKKMLVKNRLLKQLLTYKLDSFSDYFRLIQINNDEKTKMLNLITTNETYFFREIQHFDFIKENIVPKYKNKKIRIWSAASSIGAEAYSIAMLLNDLSIDYEIIGSDINSEVVKKANVGLYPIKMMDKIPEKLKIKYCLKGKRSHEGWFLVDRCLLERMKFEKRNLLDKHLDLGEFDIIFLRNVLIYFNKDMKENIILNILNNLKLGGLLILSLTEYLRDLEKYKLKKISNSIFQKVG